MFADSPKVTYLGLLFLRNIKQLKYLHLRGLAAASITDSVIKSLHFDWKCQLVELKLGSNDTRQQTKVTPAAFTRSGGETRTTTLIQGIIQGVSRLTRAREGGGEDFALPPCFSEISKNLRLNSYQLFST